MKQSKADRLVLNFMFLINLEQNNVRRFILNTQTLKHFIGLPYTGFANTHANTKHWGKILKNKTKHTQLSTDRGQDIFQYSNDFLIVLFRDLVTRIICEQSNIYLVEPCYIQVSISKIIRYVFLVLNTVHAHMYNKFGTNSPDIEGLAAIWTLWRCQMLANLARLYTFYHRSLSFVYQNAGMKITNVWLCLRLCNIQDTYKYQQLYFSYTTNKHCYLFLGEYMLNEFQGFLYYLYNNSFEILLLLGLKIEIYLTHG